MPSHTHDRREHQELKPRPHRTRELARPGTQDVTHGRRQIGHRIALAWVESRIGHLESISKVAPLAARWLEPAGSPEGQSRAEELLPAMGGCNDANDAPGTERPVPLR